MPGQKEPWAIRAGSAWLRFCIWFGIGFFVLCGPLLVGGIIVFLL